MSSRNVPLGRKGEEDGERAGCSISYLLLRPLPLYIGGRISLQCSKIRGDGSWMDGWTMWPSLPLPLPAALFDAAELMEEAKVAGAEISAKRPTEVRWFVHSGNYEFMM